MTNQIILCDQGGRWMRFHQPREILRADRHDEIRSLLERIEAAVEADGLHAAGFIAYEGAPAFDSALQVRTPGKLPLAWFGLYPPPESIEAPPAGGSGDHALGEWTASVGPDAYRRAFDRIKDDIARGDTYQVNYTLRLRARFSGSPRSLFARMVHAQPSPYAAFVEAGPFAICSASPELFFALDGSRLTSRPMKGTAPRGRTLAEDQANMAWLHRSQKNRAENVMIVDMVRNDMGRIAETGSVRVPRLFHVERYPTVLQMTSTVSAETRASLPELLAALFPCASVTGAPKVSTMRIIAELESSPRGVYTGCIGYFAPGRQAQFNVAIRTVAIDREAGTAEYGVGGGIVWDSVCEGEYAESMLKARVLTRTPPDFDLLETLLWEPDGGYFLLEEHLHRLAASAEYFCFRFSMERVREALGEHAHTLRPRPHKVRLLLKRDGQVALEALPLGDEKSGPVEVALAAAPVDPESPYLYHKTTHRKVYEAARSDHPYVDDVLMWNPDGELTESTIANLVVRRDGELLTPAASSGLLPGVFRAHLLSRGVIREAVLRAEELPEAEALYLVNSVRKWRPAVLVGAHEKDRRRGEDG